MLHTTPTGGPSGWTLRATAGTRGSSNKESQRIGSLGRAMGPCRGYPMRRTRSRNSPAKPQAAMAVISFSLNRLSLIIGFSTHLGPLDGQPMQRFKLLTVAALLALGLVPVMVDATPQQAAPATDQHGDALPAGAVARLGTGRFRHGSTPTFVAFLPGGKEVISVSDDKTARVWEYPSGKEIRRFGPEETD